MFRLSFGETFMELWVQIPTIINYHEYVGMANVIDDNRTGRAITDRDEKVLLEALEIFRKARGIQKEQR